GLLFSNCTDSGRDRGPDTPPRIPFPKISRETAYLMMDHYLDTVKVDHRLRAIIKSIELSNQDVNALMTDGVVRLKLLTAADLKTNLVTILIQQKIRKGTDSSYAYYDMNLTEALKSSNRLCPPPENCAPERED
ncbi:MAG: hypothetical protein WKF70_03955, partial [Chitinophagaceae bacterium]